LNNRGHYPCISIKGQDTWRVGNEFKGNLFGIFPFIARVEKCLNYPEIKKIKWLFHISYRDYILIKLELLKVTEDNTCVLSSILKVENVDSIDDIDNIFNYEKNKQLYSNIEKLLESKPINLFQYESGVISGSMEDIWDFITNISKLKMIAPLIKFDGNENFKDSNCGDNLIFNLENQSKKIYSKILVKNKNEKWNKWICVLQIMKGEPKIPMQKLIIELTKINQSDCQLILLTKNV